MHAFHHCTLRLLYASLIKTNYRYGEVKRSPLISGKRVGPKMVLRTRMFKSVKSIVVARVNHATRVTDIGGIYCLQSGRGILRMQLDSIIAVNPTYATVLFVNDKNTTARAAYDHLGWKPFGDGSLSRRVDVFRPTDPGVVFTCMCYHGGVQDLTMS